jgi:protocatechuate 3,4-dioxygenase beta subunit
MKKIITVLIIALSFSNINGQTFSLNGIVTDKSGNPLLYTNVTMISENYKIAGQTDSNGFFAIRPIKPGNYKVFSQNGECDISDTTTLSINQDITNVRLIFDIHLKHISTKYCPFGHSDHLIPIVYSLPDKKLIKKSKKGKIILRGCVLTPCSPKWYCPIHDFSF